MPVEKSRLAAMLDHTLLKPQLTRRDLDAACEVALRYSVGSMCVKPCDVARAAVRLAGSPVGVSTVVGFPLGISTSRVKALEAEQAIADGARGLDMVMNITALKSGEDTWVADDIARVVALDRQVPVKVIIEACFLTEEEKRRACALIVAAGAAFVKTSTGFGPGGATEEDVRLLRRAVGPDFGVKAAGGIRTFAQAAAMLAAGANRLGVSATEAIMRGCESQEG